jgi:hypothetical protein
MVTDELWRMVTDELPEKPSAQPSGKLQSKDSKLTAGSMVMRW